MVAEGLVCLLILTSITSYLVNKLIHSRQEYNDGYQDLRERHLHEVNNLRGYIKDRDITIGGMEVKIIEQQAVIAQYQAREAGVLSEFKHRYFEERTRPDINFQSGGVRADVEGDLSTGGDILGRDKGKP